MIFCYSDIFSHSSSWKKTSRAGCLVQVMPADAANSEAMQVQDDAKLAQPGK